MRYYSLVTFPRPERISSVLKSSYRKLASIDTRNDGQVIFYDQVIPGSDLMAYVNADHWALALPIARSHATIGAVFVTENAYPREALLEAVLRFVEEDLSNTDGIDSRAPFGANEESVRRSSRHWERSVFPALATAR